eukprot:TRINITY_DN12654_c0_g1_i2.p1 TRINITY_DN12654_c0_g1~~TRINITY_DN12654_c0_g1_i2.p1  ORF type:complete len:407 (-),score=100.15 TRINITY_DN12654_c0_g1_i2:271-1491(-)
MKIKVLSADPTAAPILASFPLGPPQELLNAKPEQLEIHAFAGSKPSGALKRKMVLRGDVMEYVGKSAIGSSPGCKYLLGVYNSQSNKLKLAQPTPVLGLSAEFIGQSAKERAEHEQQKRDREGMKSMTASERFLAKQSLVEKFGSKAKQQELKSKRSNIVSQSNIANTSAVLAQIQTSAKSAPKGTGGGQALEGVPPYKLDATEEHEIFPVLSCMPKQELEALKKEAISYFGAKSDPAAQGYSGYICHLARKTNTHPKLSEVQRGMCLAHLGYCIMLKGMSRSFSEKRAATLLDPCPAATRTGLLSRFAEESVNEFDQPVLVRPPKMGDKLLLHICCAALILDSFQVEIPTLAADLKMSEQELEPYFKALGCTSRKRKNVERNETVTTAVLTAPLKFPAPSKKIRR